MAVSSGAASAGPGSVPTPTSAPPPSAGTSHRCAPEPPTRSTPSLSAAPGSSDAALPPPAAPPPVSTAPRKALASAASEPLLHAHTAYTSSAVRPLAAAAAPRRLQGHTIDGLLEAARAHLSEAIHAQVSDAAARRDAQRAARARLAPRRSHSRVGGAPCAVSPLPVEFRRKPPVDTLENQRGPSGRVPPPPPGRRAARPEGGAAEYKASLAAIKPISALFTQQCASLVAPPAEPPPREPSALRQSSSKMSCSDALSAAGSEGVRRVRLSELTDLGATRQSSLDGELAALDARMAGLAKRASRGESGSACDRADGSSGSEGGGDDAAELEALTEEEEAQVARLREQLGARAARLSRHILGAFDDEAADWSTDWQLLATRQQAANLERQEQLVAERRRYIASAEDSADEEELEGESEEEVEPAPSDTEVVTPISMWEEQRLNAAEDGWVPPPPSIYPARQPYRVGQAKLRVDSYSAPDNADHGHTATALQRTEEGGVEQLITTEAAASEIIAALEELGSLLAAEKKKLKSRAKKKPPDDDDAATRIRGSSQREACERMETRPLSAAGWRAGARGPPRPASAGPSALPGTRPSSAQGSVGGRPHERSCRCVGTSSLCSRTATAPQRPVWLPKNVDSSFDADAPPPLQLPPPPHRTEGPTLPPPPEEAEGIAPAPSNACSRAPIAKMNRARSSARFSSCAPSDSSEGAGHASAKAPRPSFYKARRKSYARASSSAAVAEETTYVKDEKAELEQGVIHCIVKTLGRDFLLRLIKSGVNKPSITGDLWSEAAGMGLFGIYAHGMHTYGITSKHGQWRRRALIGLVACSAERHTAVSIKKWTEEALTAIGFNSSKELLERAFWLPR
ncbi:hypothetical protein AB1Y20_008819 [Prymnesium parvum]|uniref:Uncharacterized protein n=1 Tax=Prymnesium parvum TaxID=97485 RepID=A0AB34IUM8_PRYPA